MGGGGGAGLACLCWRLLCAAKPIGLYEPTRA